MQIEPQILTNFDFNKQREQVIPINFDSMF